MMKRLLAFTAMLLVGAPSWALVGLENVSFDGSLEVRGASASNETDLNDKANDHRGVTATRTRVGIAADVTEDVKTRLEVTRTPGSAGSAALYGGAAQPTSVQTEENSWVFNNAYVDVANLWSLSVRLGRQYVGEAGDLVWHLGAKDDDAMTITSIDGIAVRKAKIADKLDLDAFTGKFRESAANVAATDATSSGDINLSNLQATLRNVLPGGNIWVGLLMGNAAGVTNKTGDNINLNIARIGANGGVAENLVTYRAEFLQDFGNRNGAGVGGADVKFKGNAFDLGVGVNAPESSAGKIGVWANYLHASGDKTADNDDKSFNDFTTLGVNTSDRYYGEIFGRSNALAGAGSPLGQGAGNFGGQGQGLQVFDIGANFKPSFWSKGWFKADWYNLGTSEDTVALVSPGVTKSSKKLGNELDLTVGYDHSDNVGFKAGYAMLMPDDGLSLIQTGNTTANDTITEWFGRASVKWGGAEK